MVVGGFRLLAPERATIDVVANDKGVNRPGWDQASANLMIFPVLIKAFRLRSLYSTQ